jgi:gluconate 2-dehydrogenase alpha chain
MGTAPGELDADRVRRARAVRYLQTWDAENVFAVGARSFPQNAGFNPTGTVGTLAYRAAEGVLEYHKTGGSLV